MLSRGTSGNKPPQVAIPPCGEHNSTRRERALFQPGQSVRVNLEGLQVGNVLFHAAVNAAVGHIVRQTSQDPPKYLIKLLFSFRGVSEVEVTEDRISAG
jgi:hypothetical protein